MRVLGSEPGGDGVLPYTLAILAASSALTLVQAQEPGTRLHVIGVVQDRNGHGVSGAALHVYRTDDAPLRDPYWQHWVKRLGQPVASFEAEGDGLAAHVALTIE